MTTNYDSVYQGQFYPQQQQMYNQQYFQPVWQHQQAYQPLMAPPQAHVMQSRQMYAPSPSCPSLYSLQQKPTAYPHTQHKLIPSQIGPSLRDATADYRQHQVLQPPFQPQQRQVDQWYGYSSNSNNWSLQSQQYAAQPRHPLKYQHPVDENDPFSHRLAAQSALHRSYNEYEPQTDYQDPSFDPLKDLKLIPASASKIPPHPSVENSAVPLSEFVVDLIWEVCVNAKEQAMAMRENRQQFQQHPEPTTPGQYGSIGGERAARRTKSGHSPASLDELYFSGPQSYLSSPESPAGPLTPPSSTMSTACPIPVQFQNGKAEFMQASKEVAPWARDQYEARSAVTASPGSPSEQGASPTFRRFVKDLLTMTLVTPQVALLAMLYVARIPQVTSESGWNKFLANGMAYKLVLGSLICANKHLDDNSFRCSTWATVSSCPIADIAQAESLVLKALHFDLNVSSVEWSDWLQTLVERRARQNPAFDDVILGRLCMLVDEVDRIL